MLTLKTGKGFWVGDDLFIVVYILGERKAKLRVTRGNEWIGDMNINVGETWDSKRENVYARGKDGNEYPFTVLLNRIGNIQVRLAISAPREVLIDREEVRTHRLSGGEKDKAQSTGDGGMKMVTATDEIPVAMSAMGIVRGGQGEPAVSIVQRTVQTPTLPAKDEVIVAMMAGGANYNGVIYARGISGVSPFGEEDPRDFHILGSEGVGIVKAVGDQWEDLSVGDVVLIQGYFINAQGGIRDLGADAGDGTFAPFVKVKKDQLFRIPTERLSQFTVAQAAGMSTAPIAVVQAAKRARLKPEDHVLVWGLRGKTGTLFAQVAKNHYRVGRVVGVTSDKDRGEGAIQQGIIGGYVNRIEEKGEAFIGAALEANGGEPYDVIFDSVGGDTVQTSLNLLKPGGRLITIGGTAGYAVKIKGRPQTLSLEDQIKKLAIQPGDPILFALSTREETSQALAIFRNLGLSLEKIALIIPNPPFSAPLVDFPLPEGISPSQIIEGIFPSQLVHLRDLLPSEKKKIASVLKTKLEKAWGGKMAPRVILQDTRRDLFEPLLQTGGPFTRIGIVNDTSQETFTIDWPQIFYRQSSLHLADGTVILGSTGGQRDTIQETFGLLMDGTIWPSTEDIRTFPFGEIPQMYQRLADGTSEAPYAAALIGAPSGEMTLAKLQKQFFATAKDGSLRQAQDRASREARALRMAEAALGEGKGKSFAASLFRGKPAWDLLLPYPVQDPKDEAIGDEVVARFERFLTTRINPHQIERDGRIPLEEIKQELIDLKAFGLRIPKEQGGLGLSLTNYLRVLKLVGSYSFVLGVLLSVHQSVGVPEPLKVAEEFARKGGDRASIDKAIAQQEKYYPILAHGAISSFALTEVDAGSDVAEVKTTADWDEIKGRWVLNGGKIWVTNGSIADYTTVLARLKGTEETALFIVPTNASGLSRSLAPEDTEPHRNEFAGLRGIENGILTLQDVGVSAADMIGKPGQGTKIALETLNTGRLSMGALMLGQVETAFRLAVDYANRREQYGKRIGEHDAITQKLVKMAKTIYALEAILRYPALLVDQGRAVDIRLESGFAKLLISEMGWEVVDDALQIYGGRGYETAVSKARRGESAEPIEQIWRGFRVNRIYEGTSEIQRLAAARVALGTYIKLLNPDLMTPDGEWHGITPLMKKGAPDLIAVMRGEEAWRNRKVRRAANEEGTVFNPSRKVDAKELRHLLKEMFKALWRSSSWIPHTGVPMDSSLSYVDGTSRSLTRSLLRHMRALGPKLQQHQGILFDLVDVASYLYLAAATRARTEALKDLYPRAAPEMFDLFSDLFTLDMAGKIDGRSKVKKEKEHRELNRKNRALGLRILDGLYTPQFARLLLDGIVLTDWPAPDVTVPKAAEYAKDGSARKASSFEDVLNESGIFGPEHDPAIATLDGARFEEGVGIPGEFPFIRGNFPTGYRQNPWRSRKYSGGKTPRDTNTLFKNQINTVGKDLSVAYDLLTQRGFDPDSGYQAEAGGAGVSIASLQDYEELWDGIPLDKVTTSHTINQTAPIMFAMYLAVARRQGLNPKSLRATFQNDVLKEYLSRNTYRLPLDGTLRLWVDMQAYIAEQGLSINGTSISSYHIREAGATAVQEVAFMFANALEYLSAARKRGLSVNEIASTITFFVNLKPDIFEEVAKLRVFRSVWAKLVQELQRQEGVEENPKAQLFKVMAYTGGTDTVRQKPQNNIARIALKLISGPLGGAQAVNAISFDEPFTINTEHPEIIAIDTMHILEVEKGLTQIVDMLGGSYLLEAKTRELEEAVWRELAKIAQKPTYQDALSYMGGPRGEIARSALEEQRAIASGRKKKVGVNVATEGAELFPPIEEPNPDTGWVGRGQAEKLRLFKEKRNGEKVASTLRSLHAASLDPDRNVIPYLIEAVEAGATVGEIMEVWTKVFGEADPTEPWQAKGVGVPEVETFTLEIRDFVTTQANSFTSGVDLRQARERKYLMATDLPYVREMSPDAERPGVYPYTRGIDLQFPVFVPADPEGDMAGTGYQWRGKGVSAVEEVAFALIQLEQQYSYTPPGRRFVPSVWLSSHNNFLEEVAKFRAARRVWAKRMRKIYKVTQESTLKLHIHARTDQSTYTLPKFWNNNTRAAWQVLQAYLGQVQTIQVTPFDAPFGEPTELSALAEQMAENTFETVQHETGLGEFVDPAGGSFALEAATDRLEQEITALLDRLEEAEMAQRIAIEKGEIPIVGVNVFKDGVDPKPTLLRDLVPPTPLSEPTIPLLASTDLETRRDAASGFYQLGADLAFGARETLGATDKREPLFSFLRDPYTVGLAVTPEHFDRIREAWGNPPLSWVPEDVGVEEFEIVEGGIHLDILHQKKDHPDRTIEQHIAKRGEGIQQIEFLTPDVNRALEAIRQETEKEGRNPRERIRVVLAKPGLDGHDRGIKVISTELRDAGMEVIYLGLFQTPETIVNAAIQEDADVIAVSIHSGAHMTYLSQIRDLLHEQNASDILVVAGGVIPQKDRETLQREEGVPLVYSSDASVAQMIEEIKNWVAWFAAKDRIKIVHPDKEPREGANHTRVKFFLLTTPDGRKVLTELVQESHKTFASADGGVKSGDFLLAGRARVAEDVLHYPEQLLEDDQSEPALIGKVFERFVRERVMPHSEALDQYELMIENPIPATETSAEKPSIKDQAAAGDMLGITVPGDFGGMDVRKVTKIVADLWAWYGDPSFGSLIRVHGGVGTMPIVNFGTEEQKQKYLPKLATGEYIGAYLLTDEAHGSDSLSKGTRLQAKAVLKKDPDGTEYWELSGNKRFVTNARFSNLFTVFAMTQNEAGEWVKSAFVVERDTPGVVVEKDYHKMGLRGSSTADVKFEEGEVRVPKENLLGEIGQGTEIGMSILNHGRTAVAAGSLGGSLRLFEETLNYTTTRPQFGQFLSDFGAVRETLADMVVSLYAQESVVYAVAGLFDGGEDVPSIEAASAKVFGSENLIQIARQAVQKHGGNGIMDEYAASRFYRDAAVMSIFEGANEILLSQVIAPLTLKYLKTHVWPEGKSIFSDWNVREGASDEVAGEKGILFHEFQYLDRAAVLVDQAAKRLEEKFETREARKAPETQSYFMSFGKMIMELFAMSSTLSRTLRRLEKGYDSTQEVKLTKVFLVEALDRIQNEASLILEPVDSPRVPLPATHTLLALKHDIASKTIALGKYAPSIAPAQSAKDAGSKTPGELYAEVVTAFGGDKEQAEKDIEARLSAMRKVSPDAMREEAVARLAWEYQPRPTEHVFPGDSFSFMYRAATSSAHILLLDLEDAVATPRKKIARDVIMLLIRAFRGEVLAPEQMNFVWENAIINPKDKEAGVEKFFNWIDGGFQLKHEYWFPEDQMILVRPNNLRTKWTAGDYAIVIRGIGHLIDGIYMPKVEGFDKDVEVTVGLLRAIQREQGWVEGRHKIFVLTELPGAVLNAKKILATAPEVEEAQLGVVDYTAATGGKNAVQLDHFTYMRYPMLHIVESARATGKVAGTGITVKLTVEDTAADVEKVTKLGIHRKWSVHPNHLKGMQPYLDQFPPVVRQYRDYPEIKYFDLAKLDRLAKEAKPILPPKVFVPRETELVRSVVEVKGDDLGMLETVLGSDVDMVVIDIDSLAGQRNITARGRLIAFFKEKETEKAVALQDDFKQAGSDEALIELIDSLRHVVGAVIVSGVETVKDIREADGLLTALEKEKDLEVGTLRLGARIKNPETVEKDTYPIASASRRLNWLFLDLKGLPKEAPDDPTTKGYNYYRSAFIAGTSLTDVDAIDGRSATRDLEPETLLAANWGFHGKVGTLQQVATINDMMNPQRAGEAPEKPTKESDADVKKTWAAFLEIWKNSVKRDLAILEDYAIADQDRKLGAVGFTDPYTGLPEIVDAASARIPYKQMERALKAGILDEDEKNRYLKARERLLLALRPGGTEGGTRILPGQRLLGHAVSVGSWMVKGFAKTSLDRNRYHLDKAYADASRFKGLVAHGLFTLSSALTGLEQILPDYKLATINTFKFTAPVRYGDTIVPIVEGLEVKDDETTVQLSAVNQDGTSVFEAEAVLEVRTEGEPYKPVTPTSSDLVWLMNWVQDVTPSVPNQIYDFTEPQSPRVQFIEKGVTTDLILATRTLFGKVSPELLSQLLAIGSMAMASAESVPGHLLLGGKNLEFGVPVQEDDKLTATATVPAPGDIKRSKANNMPIVPVDIVVTNQKGEIAFKGQVTKLMEPITSKDGADRKWHSEIAAVIQEAPRVAEALLENPGAELLTDDSPLSVKTLAESPTVLAVDASLLVHEVTRKEFEIILSLLKSAGRSAPIWLVETEPRSIDPEALRTITDLYGFVKLMPLTSYHPTLTAFEQQEVPLIRVSYRHNKEVMRLSENDVQVTRPQGNGMVSAFGFMSLALSKDSAFDETRGALGGVLQNIQSTYLMTPSPAYLEAIEMIYQYL